MIDDFYCGDSDATAVRVIVEEKVTLESHGEDSYGRTLGTLKIDGRNINREMVEEGWAWQYVQYDKSDELRKAQDQAKRMKLGLWADAEPVAPWELRRREAKQIESERFL